MTTSVRSGSVTLAEDHAIRERIRESVAFARGKAHWGLEAQYIGSASSMDVAALWSALRDAMQRHAEEPAAEVQKRFSDSYAPLATIRDVSQILRWFPWDLSRVVALDMPWSTDTAGEPAWVHVLLMYLTPKSAWLGCRRQKVVPKRVVSALLRDVAEGTPQQRATFLLAVAGTPMPMVYESITTALVKHVAEAHRMWRFVAKELGEPKPRKRTRKSKGQGDGS